MYKSFILFFILISLLYLVNADDTLERRVLESVINPNCDIDECKNPADDSKSDLSIVYVKSSKFKNNQTTGPNFHFFLSTYAKTPAIFIVSTHNKSNLNINWKNLINNKVDSIQFLNEDKKTSLAQNSIGILIDKIFFWLDNEKGDANFNPNESVVKVIDADLLKWKKAEILTQSKDNVHVHFELKEPVYNGTIKIRFMISSTMRQYTDLPSLLLTSKAIHTQLTLDGFEDVFPFNSTNRLGLQLAIVSKGEKYAPQSYDTFDDEHAPGIFTTVKYPFGQFKFNSSFLSFKPFSYINSKRMISQTIDTIQKEMIELKSKDVFKKNNAFNGFYGNSEFYTYQMNITFGSKEQNFYSKTNYTEFSFVSGLGDLPQPKMSLFIQLVIIIGAGLSILVLIAFPISIYLMARKMRYRKENALLNNQDQRIY